MRSTDSVGVYLSEIGPTRVPSVVEERQLARKARLGREAAERLAANQGEAGDARTVVLGRRAHTELLTRNLKLVVAVAKRYQTSGPLDLADLIQEGNLGLDHAISKFDERLGFKLSTYAVKWIRQGISRALDRHSATAKVPIATVGQVRSALRHNGGDVDGLPACLRAAALAWQGRSLNAPLPGSDNLSLGDALGSVEEGSFDQSLVDRLYLQDLTTKALAGLDRQTRRAVVRRYGLDGSEAASIERIGNELGVSSKRAGRMLSSAHLQMRAVANDDVPQAHCSPVERTNSE